MGRIPRVRVSGVSVSLDGYAAGPDQRADQPLGAGGMRLHEWAIATRTFAATHGRDGGDTGLDDDLLAEGFDGVGATIMGRNMFGPVRGPWGDDTWRGWWGDDPPFHHPVFVLTNHPRAPLVMEGGTTFHFVTEGIEAVHERALAAAAGRDVRIGGGPTTIRRFMRAGLVDDLHLAVVPVLLGSGERIFDGIDAPATGYEVVEYIPSPSVAHMRLRRTP